MHLFAWRARPRRLERKITPVTDDGAGMKTRHPAPHPKNLYHIGPEEQRPAFMDGAVSWRSPHRMGGSRLERGPLMRVPRRANSRRGAGSPGAAPAVEPHPSGAHPPAWMSNAPRYASATSSACASRIPDSVKLPPGAVAAASTGTSSTSVPARMFESTRGAGASRGAGFDGDHLIRDAVDACVLRGRPQRLGNRRRPRPPGERQAPPL